MSDPNVTEAMVEAGAQALYKSEMSYVSKYKTMDEAGKLAPIYRKKSRIILEAALAAQPAPGTATPERGIIADLVGELRAVRAKGEDDEPFVKALGRAVAKHFDALQGAQQGGDV